VSTPAETFAAAFEQWKADYDADPESFVSHPDFLATPPTTYGESAARTFLRYLGGES
jgi:hypothetical protein